MKAPYKMTREEWFRDGTEYVTTDSHGIRVTYFFRPRAAARKPRGDHGHKWHIRARTLDREDGAITGAGRVCGLRNGMRLLENW